MKIRELELNQVVDITLVVKSATARETKAKKPYLSLDFYDGTDSISGNYWDWGGTNIPQKNAILDVHAQVTEWQGVKQLNIKDMRTNTEATLSDFAPSSGVDVYEVYTDAYALLSDVKDDFIRDLALSIMEDLQQRWTTVPGAITIHHAYVAGTLVHSYSVASIAKAIAEHTPGANVDLCVVGGMLHDVGKLYAYNLNGVSVEMTDEGKLYEHSFMGAEFLGNYAESHFDLSNKDYRFEKVEMLRHIILSHHGRLEYGAPVTPASIEAHIVSHADAIDAAAEQVRSFSAKLDNAKWTDKIWALDNKPHITTQYVAEVMRKHTETNADV